MISIINDADLLVLTGKNHPFSGENTFCRSLFLIKINLHEKNLRKTVPLFAIISLLCLSAFSQSKALQKNYSLADTASVADDGLLMGYNIKSLSQKEVGDKGEFSRYSLQFYITNISAEAKIFLYNQGWQGRQRCITLYCQIRLPQCNRGKTHFKSAQLQLAACNVLALVEDRDRDNKSVKNKRFVQIGYWIKPGETVKADAIMIVPLNEKLNMNVTLYPNMNADIVSNASVMGQPPFVSAAPAAALILIMPVPIFIKSGMHRKTLISITRMGRLIAPPSTMSGGAHNGNLYR